MLTVQELHRMHVRHLRALRRSEHTITFYEKAAGKLAKWMAVTGLDDPALLTRPDINAFQLWLRDQGLAEGGEHAILRGVRALLRFGADEELLSRDPFKKVRLPKLPPDPPPAAQPDEVARLLRAARDGGHPWRDRAMIMLAYDTGLRSAELVALRTTDVDLVNGMVHVRRGKGGKPRSVPIGVRSGLDCTQEGGQGVKSYLGLMILGRKLSRGQVPQTGVQPPFVVQRNECPNTLTGFVQISVFL